MKLFRITSCCLVLLLSLVAFVAVHLPVDPRPKGSRGGARATYAAACDWPRISTIINRLEDSVKGRSMA
jgi:hypothetical protein